MNGGPDLPEFLPLPLLYLYYTPEKREESGTEQFPLYSSATRERLLAKLRLRIEGKSKDKIIAGVALFLME